MNWHQFLREERARKLSLIESLKAGGHSIFVDHKDISAEMMVELLGHVEEIESILSDAGEVLDI